jgi:glutamate-1-semialdehyde 2,1-aminomutase
MFGCFFSKEEKVNTFEQVMACNVEQFKKYFHLMLNRGVYLAPSAFEAGFVGAAHGDREIGLTLDAAEQAFNTLERS